MAYTTIDDPTLYFNTVLYTGTGATHNITGVGFQPDWVWIKNRSITANHHLFDIARGATKYLLTNVTNAEATDAQQLQSFDADGFTVGTNGNVNGSGNNIVAWNWLAGGTASSNTDGSITSSVSANTTAGFSIVSYTGNGTAGATIGHGLGSTPQVIIIKNRSSAVEWGVYVESLGSANRLALNTTAGSGGTGMLNSTDPTSSVFTLGTASVSNTSSNNYIAYCFAEKKGYSKFGSYTGNGSSDGSFIYTGFKPAFVMIKRTSPTGEAWWMWDSKRDTYNLTTHGLFANASSAEVNYSASNQMNLDLLSNGFKFRATDGAINGSGQSYIYMAFASNPFVTSSGVPACAR